MGRLPHTRREKEIWQACEALWAEHKDPLKIAGEAIRDKLLSLQYKKGSPNEVYRYRKTWQTEAGMPSPVSIDFSEPLSPTGSGVLPDPIQRAASLVREEIVAEAKQATDRMAEQIEAERLVYQEREASLLLEQERCKVALDTAQAQILSLTEDLEHQQAAAKGLEARLSAQETQIQALQEDNTLLTERLKAATEQYSALEASVAQQLVLTKTLLTEQHQALLAQEQENHAAQIQQLQAEHLEWKSLMETQRHQWMVSLDVEKTDKEKSLQKQEVLSKELERQKALLKAAEAELSRLDKYAALLELQHLQMDFLKAVSEDLQNMKQDLQPDKMLRLWKTETQHASENHAQALARYLQEQFQTQNQCLIESLRIQSSVQQPEVAAEAASD